MTPGAPPPLDAPPVLAVVGPTAVGKSELAIRLAEALGGEVVNADALQVYRGLDIGTAKPDPEVRRRVPHHLVDVLEPHEPFSAGDFARRGRAAIADIRRRGAVPIVVGGSGLYQRALFEGLSPVPKSPEVRAELERRLAVEGLAALRDQLARLDPATAGRLAPGDTQRILRALEVVVASGRPQSEWWRRAAEEPPLAVLRLGLTLPRGVLYDRISARVGRMVERGWVGEVDALLGRGISVSVPAFQAIGYREIVRHLQGESTLDEATRSIVVATRRYAKRQLTWFRREAVRWLPATDSAFAAGWPSLVDDLKRTVVPSLERGRSLEE